MVLTVGAMKVCILHPSYEGSTSPCNGLDPQAEPERWLSNAHSYKSVRILKATSASQVIQLAKEDFDVFINLCDGAWDEDRPGIDVVQALEKLNLPFTGARSHFYEPSKDVMKMVAIYHGIKTPVYRVCKTAQDALSAAAELKFPVIVKHRSGYSSIGMTRSSKCEGKEQLLLEVQKMVDQFGAALVEEFIAGREFTALVSECPEGPDPVVAYQPVECVFPEGEEFKHFDVKWVAHHGIEWRPVVEEQLDGALRSMAVTMFKALRGTGYGRIDVRGDASGELFFLEMNPNCGVFYPPEEPGSADQILAMDPSAHHGIFLDRVIRAAIQDHRRRQPSFEVRQKGEGFGLFATRNITQAEVVEHLEEKPVPLVTRAHVAANWDKQKHRWFQQYAYPVGRNVWAMWSEDPQDWKPLNHSCDPNVWLDGLNVAARRDVADGEELTIDYATFCIDSEAFDCQCGTTDCRGRVTGKDFLAPWIEEEYKLHLSDAVLTAREASLCSTD